MEDEIVALSPLLLKTLYPENPVAGPPLHFHYVRDRRCGPEIRGILFHRLSSKRFSETVISRLLKTVGITTQYKAVAWHTFAPRRKHTRDGITNRSALA